MDCFFKLHFLMTSAIRTSALISPVFTCEMASASRRTCNIRCFTQLFVVNMTAKPIWAKDVKFGVRCFCLEHLWPLLYRATLNNYWMRSSRIWEIIKAEVCVICRSRKLRQITQTVTWIISNILREPNSIIVLLFICICEPFPWKSYL